MNPEVWKSAGRPAPDCPSVDEWMDLRAGLVEAPRAAVLHRHREACAACGAQYALVVSFVDATPAAHEHADLRYVMDRSRPRPAAAASWWSTLFAPSTFRLWAMAAVLLAAVGITLNFRPNSAMPPVSGEVTGEVRATPSVRIVTPLGDVAAVPARLQWAPVDGAVQYQVQILAVDGEELWKSSLTDQTTYGPLPLDNVALPRKTVNVRVTAFDASGKMIAASADAPLRLLPGNK